MLTVAKTRTGGTIQILAALARRGQPEAEAFCPSATCGQLLQAVSAFTRVGDISVRAFFRHKKGTAEKRPCWGASGEGGLHFSAKQCLRERLQELAAASGALLVEQPCLRCATGLSHEALRLEPTDQIVIEHWLDPRRTLKPDVMLWRSGQAAFAFEVRAAHPCPPKKIAALEKNGAWMVEVEARNLMGTETVPPWSTAHPLPVKQAVLPISRRACEPCQTAIDYEAACEQQRIKRQRQAQEQAAQRWREAQQREARRREAQEQEEQRRHEAQAWQELGIGLPGAEVIAHCYLDLCGPGGTRQELELSLERSVHPRTGPRAWLREVRKKEVIHAWTEDKAADDEWLLAQGRLKAATHFKPKQTQGWVLDTYGGFRVGTRRGKWPDPNYWWDASQARWVKATLRHLLAEETGIAEEVLEQRLPPQQFRRVNVRFKLGTKDFPAFVAIGSTDIKAFLRA